MSLDPVTAKARQICADLRLVEDSLRLVLGMTPAVERLAEIRADVTVLQALATREREPRA